MTLLFALGVLFIAGAAALLTRALSIPRVRMASQLRQIESYGFGATDAVSEPAGAEWSLRARLNDLAAQIGRRVRGSGWRAPIAKVKLRAAGVYSVDPDVLHGYRVIAAIAVPAFLLLTGLRSGVSPLRVLLIIM